MRVRAGAWRAACWALVLAACKAETERLAPGGDAAGAEATPDAEPSSFDAWEVCQDGASCNTPGLTCEGFLGARCCALACTCGPNDVWVCQVSCNPSCEGPIIRLDGGDSGGKDVATDATEAEVTDAPICQESLDAWCASAQWPMCTPRDWASAVRTPASGQSCAGWSASVCGAYNVLSQRSIDSGQDDYYEKLTGQLVAIVSTGNVEVCLGGPPDFTLPSPCSPSMPLCDLLGDGGADATDSSSE